MRHSEMIDNIHSLLMRYRINSAMTNHLIMLDKNRKTRKCLDMVSITTIALNLNTLHTRYSLKHFDSSWLSHFLLALLKHICKIFEKICIILIAICIVYWWLPKRKENNLDDTKYAKNILWYTNINTFHLNANSKEQINFTTIYLFMWAIKSLVHTVVNNIMYIHALFMH